MNDDLSKKHISVSECVDLIRTTLQSVVGDIRVRGEVSEFQRRSNGSLIFFSLKDKNSYVRCFMLERELKVQIEDGMEMDVIGYPALFKKNAGFHIRVNRIEVVGEGALQKQLELTKKKLEKEGLFSEERKRSLPRFPETLGIITSEEAAAYTDVRRVLSNRWPLIELSLVPSGVQGQGAIKQLIHALDVMEQQVKPDVIILTRGGGSLEDLQAFNSEDLARKIYSCSIPVIVGVGHERDWSIADLVGDKRAATPSNAAELIVPRKEDIILQIDAMTDTHEHIIRSHIQQRAHGLLRISSILSRSMDIHIDRFKRLLQAIEHSGRRLLEYITFTKQDVFRKESLIMENTASLLSTLSERQIYFHRLLKSLSPHNVLKRGFSITRVKGKIVKSSKDVNKHDILKTTLKDGDISSEVT